MSPSESADAIPVMITDPLLNRTGVPHRLTASPGEIIVRGDPNAHNKKIQIVTTERILTWDPPKGVMKPKQKKNARAMLNYLDGNTCKLCRLPVELQEFASLPYPKRPSLDHKDGNQTHNCLHNLELMHLGCNARARGRSIPPILGAEREKNAPLPEEALIAGSSLSRWTSREGEKHDSMFPGYREFIYQLLHGKAEGYSLPTPAMVRDHDLPDLIANHVGTGVSQSFAKYLKQDCASNGLLVVTWRVEMVPRFIRGKRVQVGRDIKYIECTECYHAWVRAREVDPQARKQILDHPPFPINP